MSMINNCVPKVKKKKIRKTKTKKNNNDNKMRFKYFATCTFCSHSPQTGILGIYTLLIVLTLVIKHKLTYVFLGAVNVKFFEVSFVATR